MPEWQTMHAGCEAGADKKLTSIADVVEESFRRG